MTAPLLSARDRFSGGSIFDPAVYYGHHEAEWGMVRGRPPICAHTPSPASVPPSHGLTRPPWVLAELVRLPRARLLEGVPFADTQRRGLRATLRAM